MATFILDVASTYAIGIIKGYFPTDFRVGGAECPLSGHSEDLSSLRDYRGRCRVNSWSNTQAQTASKRGSPASVMSTSRSRGPQSDITVRTTNDWRYSVRGVGRHLGMCLRMRLRARTICSRLVRGFVLCAAVALVSLAGQL